MSREESAWRFVYEMRSETTGEDAYRGVSHDCTGSGSCCDGDDIWTLAHEHSACVKGLRRIRRDKPAAGHT